MGDAARNLDEQIRGVEEEIRSLGEEIRNVGEEIRIVEQKIDRVEEQIGTCFDLQEKAQLRGEKAQLRGKEALLRGEKAQLRGKEERLRGKEERLRSEKEQLRNINNLSEGGSVSKRRRSQNPEAPVHLQSFVQSAGDYYEEWEEKYREWEKANTAEVEKGPDLPFLKLSADPFFNFPGEIILWIRDCYRDLKKILETAAVYESFIVLGTSGIGKSYFSVFWICSLAARKKKVAWKVEKLFYLLDFSDESSSTGDVKAAKAYGPLGIADPELREVLHDRDAWLIMDGKHEQGISSTCHILLPCSAQRKNYKEFQKKGLVTTLYMPVWEEEEICGFVDAFDKQRIIYSNMRVPDKRTAMQNFECLGGVPRYVLDYTHTKVREQALEQALDELKKNICLNFIIDDFGQGDKRDAVVHIKCEPSTDGNHWNYRNSGFKLASKHVKLQLRDRFHSLSEQDVLKVLREYANSSLSGSRYGYIFELVAHAVIQQGGKFRMKKVWPEGSEEVEPLNLLQMKPFVFNSWKEVPKQLEAGTYYLPRRGNLQSIDALLYPDLLLQYFSYNQGVHGYLVQGVLDAHAALGLPQYKVCSCVPKDKYDKTGWQPWKNTGKTNFKKTLPEVIRLSEQYVIEVDYEKYGS